ncbi:MAG: 3-isopropylmalate dehydratase large subunit [Syntrophales bacterium]
MTLSERILAAHSGKKEVSPGDFVNVSVDLVFAQEQMTPLVIDAFRKLKVGKVFDPKKVLFINDHSCPSMDIDAAEQAKTQRLFAKEQGTLYFGVGRGGIEHVLIPEEGLALPGQVIVGADSHTVTSGALGAFATGLGSTDIAVAMATGEVWMRVPPTIKFVYHGKLPKWVSGKDLILYTIGDIGVDGALYSAMEFAGEAIGELGIDGRFTMANMAVEAGAKNGIFPVDAKTIEYLRQHGNKSFTPYDSSENAQYAKVIEYDVSMMEPQVALPSIPSNVKPVSQTGNIKLDQVMIGACTNGRLSDLRVAAEILKGKHVHHDLRCIIIPGSQRVYLDALEGGMIETFIKAGAAVSTPTCGPCAGLHMGVLAAGERGLSTTNRNFVGRMGSPKSEVYLASPAVAAASAVLGRIASPEEVVS